MNVGQLAGLLATLDPGLPVCLMVSQCPAEISAVVADAWYVPAEPGGLIYLGPHAVLTAINAQPG